MLGRPLSREPLLCILGIGPYIPHYRSFAKTLEPESDREISFLELRAGALGEVKTRLLYNSIYGDTDLIVEIAIKSLY